MNGRKNRITATILGLGAVGALGGRALARIPSAVAPAPAPALHSDAAFTGVELWDFRQSTLVAVGTAASLTYDRQSGSALALGAVVDLPRLRSDPRPVHVEAGEAWGHLADRSVDASGGVLLRRADGEVRTSSAHYDGRTERANGAAPTTLTSQRFTVRGSGFSFDAVSGQVDLLGPVDARGKASP